MKEWKKRKRSSEKRKISLAACADQRGHKRISVFFIMPLPLAFAYTQLRFSSLRKNLSLRSFHFLLHTIPSNHWKGHETLIAAIFPSYALSFANRPQELANIIIINASEKRSLFSGTNNLSNFYFFLNLFPGLIYIFWLTSSTRRYSTTKSIKNDRSVFLLHFFRQNERCRDSRCGEALEIYISTWPAVSRTRTLQTLFYLGLRDEKTMLDRGVFKTAENTNCKPLYTRLYHHFPRL